MLREVRLNKIEDSLRGQPFLEIKTLSQQLHVSEATVRRDLEALHQAGRLVRTRGGALTSTEAVDSPKTRDGNADSSNGASLPYNDETLERVASFSQRATRHSESKAHIGLAAARLIGDGQSILIAGGTTCYAAARHLRTRQVSVVTNSLPAAALLGETLGVDVLVTGGMVYPKHDILIGPQLKQTLEAVRAADWLFIGAGGADAEGFYDTNHWEVEAQRELMARANKVALLLDSSKFERRDIIFVADWNEVDYLVTDVPPSGEFADALSAAGVQVIVEKA